MSQDRRSAVFLSLAKFQSRRINHSLSGEFGDTVDPSKRDDAINGGLRTWGPSIDCWACDDLIGYLASERGLAAGGDIVCAVEAAQRGRGR